MTTITAAAAIPTGATGYSPSGRIMIDRELMNYSGISGSNFTGVTRGVDGTTAASHAAATRIGQYQCNLASQGFIQEPLRVRSVKEYSYPKDG